MALTGTICTTSRGHFCQLEPKTFLGLLSISKHVLNQIPTSSSWWHLQHRTLTLSRTKEVLLIVEVSLSWCLLNSILSMESDCFTYTTGRRRVDRNNLDQFYDYHYRRTRKPKVSLPANFGSAEQH